ncbi:MAG: 2OG-Fe(II) oxygenase [Gammaproteobacteria bacterium]|jgi:prolyl 4-hydroxylase
MRLEYLSDDLKGWIRNVVKESYPVETIVQTLIEHEYPEDIADAVNQYINDLSLSVLEISSGTERAYDRDVHILMALNSPRVVLFGNLLSHEECDQLVAESKNRLTPSTVVNAVTGNYDCDNQVRTSQGATFRRKENPLICKIEKRISTLFQCPESRGEPIQVLNYAPGAEYKPHFDYFDPRFVGSHGSLAMGGQRFATLVMYLNDVEAGGSTIFPKVGLDVLPRKGCGLFFSYSNENGYLDERSLHAGSPVEAGEKWIATKWMRVGDYIGPLA